MVKIRGDNVVFDSVYVCVKCWIFVRGGSLWVFIMKWIILIMSRDSRVIVVVMKVFSKLYLLCKVINVSW